MYDTISELEVKPPEQSLSRAQAIYAAGIPVSAVTAWLLPVFPTMQYACVLLCLWMVFRCHMSLRTSKERHEALGASRRYSFTAGKIPTKQDRKGKVVPHGKAPWGPDYEPLGVPFHKIIERVSAWEEDGRPNTVRIHRRQWVDDGHRRILAQQEQWLRDHHPRRYEVICHWHDTAVLAAGITAITPFIRCERARVEGTPSRELIAAVAAWSEEAVAGHICSLLPLLPGRCLQRRINGDGAAWQFSEAARQILTRWFTDPQRSLVLLNHGIDRAITARGFASATWLTVETDKLMIGETAIQDLRTALVDRLRQQLGSSFGTLDRNERQHALAHFLERETGHGSIRSWIKALLVEARQSYEHILACENIAQLESWLAVACREHLAPLAKAIDDNPVILAGHLLEHSIACQELVRYDGLRLALHPEHWFRSTGDIRPSAQLLKQLRERLLEAEPEARSAPPSPADAYPRITFPVAEHTYIGRGFFWDTKHAQAYDDQLSKNMAQVTKLPPDQGDPRIYGLGLDDLEEVFLEEQLFNQHCGIFGASGVGKTRFAEPLIVQAIRGGFPVIIVDPKGDQTLVDRVFEEARSHGRGNDIHFFSLVSPKNPEVSTYNALYEYTNPADLGSRVAAVMPATKDPFWTDVGTAAAKSVCTIAHWLREYLGFINRDEKGRRLPVTVGSVPLLIPALLWRAEHPDDSPIACKRAVLDIRRRMQEPGWQPDEDQQMIVDLLQHPNYTPVQWTPNMRNVELYGVEKNDAIVAWAMKIAFFHLFLGSEEQRRPDYPDLVERNAILSLTGSGLRASMWSTYTMQRVHPLEHRLARVQPNLSQSERELKTFFDYFVPPDPTIDKDIGEILDKLREAMNASRELASRDQRTYQQHLTTLASALSRFSGERERIINAIDPDIQWRRVVEQQQIVYLYLGSLIDPIGSQGIAKAVIQDLSHFIGTIYATSPDAIKPFYLFCDEIASFINNAMIDLLNKSRGAGMRCVLIGQSIPDLEAVFQDRAKAQQVIANMSTMIQLRTQLDQDARSFSERAGEVTLVDSSRSTSMTPGYGNSGNTFIESFNAQESRNFSGRDKKKIPPPVLMNLPRGQALVHTMAMVYMVAIGMMPDPSCNILGEFGILDNSDDSRDPTAVQPRDRLAGRAPSREEGDNEREETEEPLPTISADQRQLTAFPADRVALDAPLPTTTRDASTTPDSQPARNSQGQTLRGSSVGRSAAGVVTPGEHPASSAARFATSDEGVPVQPKRTDAVDTLDNQDDAFL
jgi:hypothetical protein